MKKIDREKIFNKYKGKCAYCGGVLTKGWHVDEIEPVRRNNKYVHGHWKGEGDDRQWIDAKMVPDGCMHPERFNINNQNPACASCNINKHSGSLEDFRELIKGFMKHLNEVSTQYKIAKRYGLVSENDIVVKFHFETINNNN